MRYTGNKTREISFPLGGIGTGCIGLSGNGRLIDWEIFGKPNKGGANGFSFIAVKAERGEGNIADMRVLNGDLPPPYSGELVQGQFNGFGFGSNRITMAGYPHFREFTFDGAYPIAEIEYKDEYFPGRAALRAFNPFIPMNDRDSSIPAAFFEVVFTNTTSESLTYTAAFAMGNPSAGGVNRFAKICGKDRQISQIILAGPEKNEGDICVGTDARDVSWQEYWYRGAWFDGVTMFWRDFSAAPRFANRSYDGGGSGPNANATSDTRDHCTLSARTGRLAPGESESLRFVVSWNYPNAENYWNPMEENVCCGGECGCGSDGAEAPRSNYWRQYYAMLFKDSAESGAYSLDEWDRLYGETLEFKDLLFSDTFPAALNDAVSANISILKSPTCMRLEDGSFYAFEGCHCAAGCCEGSCTHVWNYAYALPFLFPSLERSMRTLNYKYNQGEDGSMSFRLQLPPGRERSSFRACADGQFGDVVKTYRDWKISGDTEWLKSIWAAVKRSIEYAWNPANRDKWDPGMSGVLTGRQHHTLDMELFGANSWLTGFYLAALAAAAEMAEALGEPDTAAQYVRIFKKGKAYVNSELWDDGYGYFIQKLDLRDASALDPYPGSVALTGGTETVVKSAREVYWNDETGEIKYQFGDGCAIDQVIAQWHANICGLKERVFDRDKTVKALASIHKYNHLPDLREHVNPCRLYAVNDEAGTVICAWPDGCARPAIAAPYAEETWSGCEYQAAAHMIQEGLAEEGLRLVTAVRGRYDGEKRNPWNEFECGSNYARSMASYSLLLAYSGFSFDIVNGRMGFAPARVRNGVFRCFWSAGDAWGGFEINGGKARLSVRQGSLKLKDFKVRLGGGRAAGWTGETLLTRGDTLEVSL